MRSRSESCCGPRERALTGLQPHILFSWTPAGVTRKSLMTTSDARKARQSTGAENEASFRHHQCESLDPGTRLVGSRLQMCWFLYWSHLNQTKARCQFVICFIGNVFWQGCAQGEGGKKGRLSSRSEILQRRINTKLVNTEFYSPWS